MLNRVVVTNALHFFGLQSGEKTRRRLLDFYNRNGLDTSRLPLLEDNLVAASLLR